ncbi:MAG: hypothetical protein QXN36_08060 [Candidatus Bathyarchaeia archaeon]
MHTNNFKKLIHSKKALAVPVTYLILFVSLMAVISATYSYAVVKIGSRAASLKAFVAKQNMQALDNAVRSVAWGFGASEVVYMDECGGVFRTEPVSKSLVLNFTDEQTFYDVVFNSSVGEASYQLESSESNYLGLYIRGDNRAVINQSSSIMTQLYVAASENAQAIILCYRPLATTAVIDTSNGKPVNLLRVNIINLNFSQKLTLREKFYLKITAINVTTISSQYTFNESIFSLALKASLDETSNVVWLPISSSTEGAIVNLDIVICNIKIEKTEV